MDTARPGFGHRLTHRYHKNGRVQHCQIEYVFPQFDPTKLVEPEFRYEHAA